MRIERLRLFGFRLLMASGAVATAIVAFLPWQGVLAQTAPTPNAAYEFNLPGGDLAKALDAFSTQAGVQIGFTPELVAGKRARAVSGQLNWREGLARLLQGSGLEYRQVDDGIVVIQRPGQSPSPSKGPRMGTSRNASAADEDAPVTEIESVTVTGTRIRGGTTPSPVITIGSEQIREEGFTDLGEVIRSVPQNFRGGQNPGVGSANISGSGAINQNLTGGSALNLRGLGPDTTLTLLNGKRMPYDGASQAIDISAIPVEAVERLEIVPDGASAIYGSDAVGGVGNVILKRDYEGLTIGTRYGRTTEGGLNTREYSATAGAVWPSGGVIATYKDVSIDPIYVSERSYTEHLVDPTTIYPGSDLHSGLVSVHQSIGDVGELRFDTFRTEREQLYYYFSGDWMYYAPPKTVSTFLSPSMDIWLPNDWRLSFDAAWGKDKHYQNTSRTNVLSGENMILDHYCNCNESRMYEASAEGPLFAMPGGDARLAAGAGYRSNNIELRYYRDSTTQGGMVGDESVRFAYAEISLPLVGPRQNVNGMQRLELTAATRSEDYDSFGRVTTPKLGLIYSPNADFTLKASWGKSFKAPTLRQRYYSRYAFLDPPSYWGGSGYGDDATVLNADGGNLDLQPERARTWTASLAYQPRSLPGLEVELTWFDIDYADRVVTPISNVREAMSNPIYAQFVDYTPTIEEQEAIISASEFYNYADVPYDPSNVVAIVYTRYVNVAKQSIRGVDLTGSYRFALGSGQMTVRGSGSWLDSSQQTTPTQDSYDLSGTLFSPAKGNARVGAVWSKNGLYASLFSNYSGGVTNLATAVKTASFTTFDAMLRYVMSEQEGALSGVEFALSVDNLFNREPPLYSTTSAYAVPYDATNYSAIGRFLSLSITKHW